ncbi:MAG TPA: protein translocase subunit SecD [Solirubrobacterales bacterium]|nr:protein translocase subunit SecD [Solirubrobacterales bacterium]
MIGLMYLTVASLGNWKPKLGLDLQGGLELVYEGQPTGTTTEVSGEDIEDSISIIEQRINKLGVSEPEVARLGADQITVSLPGVTDANRAAEQVGTTAQLYYYDWEPNLLGPEKTIGGKPGAEPPKEALKESEKRWEAAGRNVHKNEVKGLIFSGAYPTAYEAVKLASEQPPVEDCEDCSIARPRYYLFDKDEPGEALAGPELAKKDLYVTPTGEKLSKDGTVLEVPPGTVVVSELPIDEAGQAIEDAEPGWFALKDEPALSGDEITNPEQTYDQNNLPVVSFNFTDSGREAFQEVTRQIAQRGKARTIGAVGPQEAEALSGHFAVVLDNEVKTRPIINFEENPDGIDGRTGAQIGGGFSGVDEAQELATTLQIGALPINLKLISQTQVSATLGSEALDQGVKAGLVGLALVVIFLLLYYRFLGLVASIALGAYAVIFFALIDLIPITLTLPGIAGLVLTIGVAADSNIVIFERIKEEVRAGRSMSSAIAAGYKRGISTIIDANVVTLLTAFILFVLATAGVKGFAFTLGVGTIVSLLTAVVFTQALLGSMSRSRLLRSPSFLGAAGQGRRWHFDFMGASRWFFSISGVILVIGGLALATKQLNFGIDFESGTRITVAVEDNTDEEGVRQALEEAGIKGEEIQAVNDKAFPGKDVFQIQSHQLEPSQVREAQTALASEFGIVEDGFDSTSVGPTFGQQVADSALKALIFSMLVIAGYVALRFDPKFAIPVLIAIFHDILITAGVYSLTGKEVSSGTVAAFLTILGYSIYDTIIVFDRIRENVPRMPRAAFSQIVNRSMSEVLTRSLATSFSTLLGVTSLLVFGGSTLQDFAFAMLVGIASGTYSSIFIASPVLTAWKEREPGFVRRRLRIAEAEGGRVPAYADEIEMAKLGRDAEREGEAAPEPQAPAAEAAPTSVATAEREDESGNGVGSRDHGDTEAAATASAGSGTGSGSDSSSSSSLATSISSAKAGTVPVACSMRARRAR